MGRYDSDPLGRFGHAAVACCSAPARCVVDTGLHAKGWSREQAIDYMVQTTGENRSAMTTEVERYCAWPGQATSYKVGQTRWLKLRADAQRRLGAKFDIRDFHDVGLTAAPMPLAVLERVYRRLAEGARRMSAARAPAACVRAAGAVAICLAVLLGGALPAQCARRRAAIRRRSRGTSSSAISTSPPARRCRSCASTTARSASRAPTAHGVVRNAVLILHGTGGSGGSFVRPEFAGELFGAGPAARCHALLHRPARRHRARQVQQAERRAARALSALRLPRHGAGGLPAADAGAEGQSCAPRHGHLHGRHAHLGVGRAAPGVHGRAHAAREPADAGLRAQPRLAPHDHRCDPQRPGLEGRGLHRAAARRCAPRSRCCGSWAAIRCCGSRKRRRWPGRTR